MRTLFSYLRPSSLDEALTMKAAKGEKAYFWAGGTDITLHWKQSRSRPEFCIDLSYLEGLDGVALSKEQISLGAKTTLRTLERSGHRHPLLQTLSNVAKLMCTPQTRSIATIGGNMCTASPAADLTPVFIAMRADAVIQGTEGSRTISLERFFKDVNKTVLSKSEMLREIRIPLHRKSIVAASYHRVARTVVDIALVNAAAYLRAGTDGKINDATIGLGAVAPVVLSAPEAAALLIGEHVARISSATIAEVGRRAVREAKPISDVRASADYRRQMVETMTRRAVQTATRQIVDSL